MHWKLENIYHLPDFQDQTPLITTKTDDFSGWIDHIYVNNKVTVESVLATPLLLKDYNISEETTILDKFQAIPNENHASDHLPLGIIVSFTS